MALLPMENYFTLQSRTGKLFIAFLIKCKFGMVKEADEPPTKHP